MELNGRNSALIRGRSNRHSVSAFFLLGLIYQPPSSHDDDGDDDDRKRRGRAVTPSGSEKAVWCSIYSVCTVGMTPSHSFVIKMNKKCLHIHSWVPLLENACKKVYNRMKRT